MAGVAVCDLVGQLLGLASLLSMRPEIVRFGNGADYLRGRRSILKQLRCLPPFTSYKCVHNRSSVKEITFSIYSTVIMCQGWIVHNKLAIENRNKGYRGESRQ